MVLLLSGVHYAVLGSGVKEGAVLRATSCSLTTGLTDTCAAVQMLLPSSGIFWHIFFTSTVLLRISVERRKKGACGS